MWNLSEPAIKSLTELPETGMGFQLVESVLARVATADLGGFVGRRPLREDHQTRSALRMMSRELGERLLPIAGTRGQSQADNQQAIEAG